MLNMEMKVEKKNRMSRNKKLTIGYTACLKVLEGKELTEEEKKCLCYTKKELK